MVSTEVVLAIIGVLATLAGGLIWVVKYFADSLTKDLKEHTKAATTQSETNQLVARRMKDSQKIDKEMLAFMRSLNGELQEIVKQKKKS